VPDAAADAEPERRGVAPDTTRRQAPREDLEQYPSWIERFTHATFVHESEFGSARAPLLAREHHQWTPLARAVLAVGDQWTLLILAALAEGPARLADLRGRLPGISAGVLNRHLQQMLDLGLVSRRRHRELPPRVEYELTRAGQGLQPVVLELARWGLRNLWTRPQPREHIAIGEIFRMLPGLLADERFSGGPLELVVEGRKGRERHLFEIAPDGRLRPIAPGVRPATRMAGSPFDWVEALGPRRDYAALQVTGELQLAKRLLKALLG
jgi:DNA-binding HxlR family transcriptional regulator